ncbi:hypothetical protein BVH74_13780 [Halopseudomonas phragmitis]|uniref:Uncharacterized protein n=2 Tax=Halopseudomonas phragmitis TaxID=1931241 RepID=A0A1V0B7I5_9GAMM|nr:hypothetical protein [Halopseudomonas phragmitis]AQZ95754.1 hypothetical protein BVH74_13780 [Halopseudomonas phragmitis]
MIWHLVALAAAGLGAAGIGFLLRAASGRKLPKWIVPVFAGMGMLTYQIYYEYYWFEHKQSQLPASSVVVATEQQQAIWRPWTYLLPMTVGFSVVDRSNLTEVQLDDNRIKRFILYRFQKEYVDLVSHQPHLLNCDTQELVPEADDGSLRPELMRKLDSDDPLYLAVCR